MSVKSNRSSVSSSRRKHLPDILKKLMFREGARDIPDNWTNSSMKAKLEEELKIPHAITAKSLQRETYAPKQLERLQKARKLNQVHELTLDKRYPKTYTPTRSRKVASTEERKVVEENTKRELRQDRDISEQPSRLRGTEKSYSIRLNSPRIQFRAWPSPSKIESSRNLISRRGGNLADTPREADILARRKVRHVPRLPSIDEPGDSVSTDFKFAARRCSSQDADCGTSRELLEARSERKYAQLTYKNQGEISKRFCERYNLDEGQGAIGLGLFEGRSGSEHSQAGYRSLAGAREDYSRIFPPWDMISGMTESNGRSTTEAGEIGTLCPKSVDGKLETWKEYFDNRPLMRSLDTGIKEDLLFENLLRDVQMHQSSPGYRSEAEKRMFWENVRETLKMDDTFERTADATPNIGLPSETKIRETITNSASQRKSVYDEGEVVELEKLMLRLREKRSSKLRSIHARPR